ncbi:MAG: 3-hydroxyacyl-CoA dehydrogenase [Chloroflexi bacterium]|nr:3-hydroxyacyl-CoA dehydrogenase [Chloroflexota bacterium]
MYIFKAGVVGAGTMGAEIAQVISYSGLPVVLKDIDQAILDKGMQKIHGIYQRRVDRGKMDLHTMEEKLALIELTLSYDGFKDLDVIIEAVPENIDLKVRVFQELDGICPEGAIFASNTSALSISEMGAATQRPEKMIGIHFFFPAHVMKLVEVIPGLDTAQDTVDSVVSFAESLRKIPVVVKECPGFLVNRLLAPFLNEAVRCVQEGAATPEEIDKQVAGFGMPMGPLVLSDALGLDVAWSVAQTLYTEYGERMRPPRLFQLLVEAGRLGEKAGAGFYEYGADGKESLPVLIEKARRETTVTGSEFSVERCLLPLINEAALCLEENIASPADIDMAMMAGTGMRRGDRPIGPLGLADEMGLDAVLGQLEEFQRKYGERFRPARYLRLKVKAKHLGKKVGKGFLEYAA